MSIIEDLIAGALEIKILKRVPLVHARLRIETLKRLIRLMHELKVVPEKWYIATEQELQEISKMLNGWIRYIDNS